MSGSLERLIIWCGYGREVENINSNGDENIQQFQQLVSTLWDDQIEGLHDYYLPELHNQRGGIYEIRMGDEGLWEGVAGEMPESYLWLSDYKMTFGF